jgi:hypothetical protein
VDGPVESVGTSYEGTCLSTMRAFHSTLSGCCSPCVRDNGTLVREAGIVFFILLVNEGMSERSCMHDPLPYPRTLYTLHCQTYELI